MVDRGWLEGDGLVGQLDSERRVQQTIGSEG